MNKRILSIAMALALVAMLAAPLTALASNSGTQNASTSESTSVNIVAKTGDTAISTITFPQDLPGAIISSPYSDVDSGAPQVLSGTVSEPVVRLKNTSTGALNITLQIATWTNGIVVSERYELVNSTTTTVNAVNTTLSSNGSAATVATGVSMAAGTYKALYLQVTLGDLGNKSGSSTITILGES